MVEADNKVRYRRRVLQIEPRKFRYRLAKFRRLVYEYLDGNLSLYDGLYWLGRYDTQRRLLHEDLA